MKKLGKLYQFSWPGVHMHQLMPPSRAWIKDFAKLGSPFSFLGVTYISGTGSFWIIEDEYVKQGFDFYRKVKESPKILLSILDRVDHAADAIFDLGKKWNFIDLSSLSTKKLLDIHKELFEQGEILWRQGQPQNLLELYNSYLSSEVKDLIKTRFGLKRQAEVFTALTTGLYDSFLEQQDRDFLSLLRVINSMPAKSLFNNRAVLNHWKKYTFMTYGWEGPDFSMDYFVSNLLEAKKTRDFSKLVNEKLVARAKLREKQKSYLREFPARERELVELLRTILDSKAKRIDAHSQTYFLGDKLLAKLGKRKGFSVSQLRTIDPIGFKKRYLSVTADELNADYKMTVLWWEKGKKQKKFNGKKAEVLLERMKAALPPVKQVALLQGELAYPGKVRGRARVVIYAQSVKSFAQGEILIAKITDPSYVPIMKKAGAIVTDVGGITCHAAIVARELRIPCLIGTKVATQIFKDGDLVEVDANKGIVRLIETRVSRKRKHSK